MNHQEIVKSIRLQEAQHPLHEAVRVGDVETTTVLIQQGMDINAYDFRQDTPLAIALQGRNEAILTLLIKAGVDLERRNLWDQTPLKLAMQGPRKFREMYCRHLLEAGALPDATSKSQGAGEDGLTALHDAVWGREKGIVELLLLHGANPNYRTAGQGNTPLHMAVRLSEEGLCELLIRSGADPECQNKLGKSPLSEAPESLRIQINRWRLEDAAQLLEKSDIAEEGCLTL